MMKFKRGFTMFIEEADIIQMLQRWFESKTLTDFGSKIVSVKQSRASKKFIVQLEPKKENTLMGKVSND